MAKEIYYNGQVYTGELPLVEAFIVKDGLFTFAGKSKEVLALKEEGDKIIDLCGSFVCAGFNDSHMHLLGFGQKLFSAPLNEYTDSLEHMIEGAKTFFLAHPVSEDAWLMGRGFNQDYFTDTKEMPSRYDLDRISMTQPVCAVRCCGHCLVVNSKALELLGIRDDSSSPSGGRIGMADGKPDGRFYDNAMQLVYDAIPLPDKDTIKKYLYAACQELNKYGITSCQTDDFCSFRKLHWSVIHDAYKELEAEGKLSVRVFEQANFESLKDLTEYVEAGNVTGKGSELFKVGPLKMLGDGSLGARTAYLSRPYADDPSTSGIPVFNQETFDEMIDYANAHDMSVAVHAIGDACLDQVLSAIEKALLKNPKKDHRHGIVHCQITRPEQLKKICDLNLHIYAQSIFLDYDINMVHDRVGEELASSSYCWKSLMKEGISVSNGSDCPVELPNVLSGMQCAVTRKTLKGKGPYLKEEAFTVKEAIDSFTIRGAEASFEEDRKGKIEKGYLADFVVLDRNLFDIPLDEISKVKVISTHLGR